MNEKEIKLNFSEARYNVLKYYMEKIEMTPEAELNAHLNTIYEKTVPKQTREYVDFQVTQEHGVEEETEDITAEPQVRQARQPRQPRQSRQNRSQEPESTPSESNEIEAAAEPGLEMQ